MKVSFELISPGTSFRDPYAAFSTAISVQFTVAGASSDSARQTHWPATARAQMLWTRLSPPMLEIVTSKADRAVMAVTIERDCPVCLGFVGLPEEERSCTASSKDARAGHVPERGVARRSKP